MPGRSLQRTGPKCPSWASPVLVAEMDGSKETQSQPFPMLKDFLANQSFLVGTGGFQVAFFSLCGCAPGIPFLDPEPAS